MNISLDRSDDCSLFCLNVAFEVDLRMGGEVGEVAEER